MVCCKYGREHFYEKTLCVAVLMCSCRCYCVQGFVKSDMLTGCWLTLFRIGEESDTSSQTALCYN
jgi:hypothetical protein